MNFTERGYNSELRGLAPELRGLAPEIRGLNLEMRGLNNITNKIHLNLQLKKY